MSEVLSIADIEGLYPNEWILVEDPITNDALEVQSGKVLWHTPIATTYIVRRWSRAREILQCFARARCLQILRSSYDVWFQSSPRRDRRSGPRLGPWWERVLRCILDTGSTNTSISPVVLATLSYDLAVGSDLMEVTTASNVTFARGVVVDRIRALDNERVDFEVLGISLPPSANVDGLLGLDFFRGQSLLIDFRVGEITLN